MSDWCHWVMCSVSVTFCKWLVSKRCSVVSSTNPRRDSQSQSNPGDRSQVCSLTTAGNCNYSKRRWLIECTFLCLHTPVLFRELFYIGPILSVSLTFTTKSQAAITFREAFGCLSQSICSDSTELYWLATQTLVWVNNLPPLPESLRDSKATKSGTRDLQITSPTF